MLLIELLPIITDVIGIFAALDVNKYEENILICNNLGGM